jgi:hypothetical protein
MLRVRLLVRPFLLLIASVLAVGSSAGLVRCGLGTRYRSHLLALVATCAFAPALALAAPASAATLSVSGTEVAAGEWSVTVSGQTERESEVYVSIGNASQPCEKNSSDGSSGSWAGFPFGHFTVPAGSFSQKISMSDSSGRGIEPKQILCGYLDYTGIGTDPDAPSPAVASAYMEPPVYVAGVGYKLLDVTARTLLSLEMTARHLYNGIGDSYPIEGTSTLNVSPATRKRLKLPRTVIARGEPQEAFTYDPEFGKTRIWRYDFKASRAVLKRLRTVRSLPVVLKINLLKPFTMPVSHAVTMRVKKTKGSRPEETPQLLVGWCDTGERYARRGGCVAR